jgi:hypothetical protein
MTNSTHTTGPWECRHDRDGCDEVLEFISLAEECSVAEIRYWPGDDGEIPPRVEANARLIRSAPGLLAACRMVVDRWEGGDLAEAARACGVAIAEATAGSLLPDPPGPDLPSLLAGRRMIAAVWSVEDVREIRPDLTDEQAWRVLQEVERRQDATLGITWDTLEWVAGDLFGDAPETDDAEG